jgi:hypothetical protein
MTGLMIALLVTRRSNAMRMGRQVMVLGSFLT